MDQSYNAASIDSLSDIQHIRTRPSAYIPDTGNQGIYTVIRELIDNAIDECEFLGRGTIDVIMLVDETRSNFKLIVSDTGRGIPAEQLIQVFSSARTSGKFTTDSYRFSIGTFGVGSTVTCALSQFFRAITLNQRIIADATIPYDNIPTGTTTVTNQLGRTGTIVMFSPDPTIFLSIKDFVENPILLMEYLSHHSLFGEYNIRLFVLDEGPGDDIENKTTLQLIDYVEKISTDKMPIFDSKTFDRENYINTYFNVSRKWDGIFPVFGINEENTLRVHGDLLINVHNNVNSQKSRLTFINNLLFDDMGSLHIEILFKFIKSQLCNQFDKSLRTFFMDHYRLPIWLVLDIKYSGAQFSGYSKVSFKDISFRHPYHALLKTIINKTMLESMYELIKDHVLTQYNKFTNSEFKPSTMKNLLSRLNRPEKFLNCATNNREIAELFLIEGDSAKSDQDRDSDFQASYTLGGKPFNGLTDQLHLIDSVNNIKKNAIFEDIIRILNITPGSNDLSSLNFGKVFITADADTHGYHITNIVTGNLMAICPEFINQGRLYVVLPPLYSLSIKNGETIYLRDATELNVTMAYYVYFKCLDITLQSDLFTKTLSRQEFVAFAEMVTRIGEELDRLSIEYTIPAVLLEQLSLMTNHLNFKNPNVEEIKHLLGCDVRYVKSGHMLIISIGSDDIIVPLNQITDLIYERILPLYREFYYGRTKIFATTKNTNELDNTPVTIVQVNMMFNELNKMFHIQRYKGLGSMKPEDRRRNCIAPATRRVFQITNIGDVRTIFSMLGTDPTERKKLVCA